jgi:hypothetical protein
MKPAVVFGDVHGQSDQLYELIKIIREKFGNDVDIYSVGDIVDRGPDAKGVIDICVKEGVRGQIGNHEQWLQSLVRDRVFESFCLSKVMGGENTFHSYDVDPYSDGKNYLPQGRPFGQVAQELLSAMPDSHKEWVSALPPYRKIEVSGKVYWLIHAGLTNASAAPWIKEGASDDEMMETIVSAEIHPGGLIQRGVDSLLWTRPEVGLHGRKENLFHFKDAVQVFGHRPLKEPIINGHFIAIDTGCGTTDPYTLSAIVLPSMELIQVESIDDW